MYVVVAGSLEDGLPQVEQTAIFVDADQATEYETSLVQSGDFAWVSGGLCERIEPYA